MAEIAELEDVVSEEPRLPTIEVGWVVAGIVEHLDSQAIRQARDTTRAFCQQRFPQFDWKMPLVDRDEMVLEPCEEPVTLLERGVRERNSRHWDFTIVVTGVELLGHYRGDVTAAVSRTLESAVISTSKIDPRFARQQSTPEDRVARIASRLRTIALHAVFHLAGLDHHPHQRNLMYDFRDLADVDAADEFTEFQASEVAREMRDTADRRLEETPNASGLRIPLFFVIHAAWLNRAELIDAIVDAKPWQFPFRLSRLTTAAASAMLLMVVTAEVWDLGMSQTGLSVFALSLLGVVVTTGYIIAQQRLLARRGGGLLTEQAVVTAVATAAIVLVGMTVTYGILFAASIAICLSLFTPSLAQAWTTSHVDPLTFGSYAKLAGFIASLCIFIAALGASFERQAYFRHITFVDEEI